MRWAAIILAALTPGPVHAQEPVEIGVAAKIENTVTGAVAENIERLAKDSPVYLDERLSSKDNATGQFVLRDDTMLAIGPNSELVLDRFVYDPAKNTGEVVIEAARGAFRFVSGKSAKTAYTIKTPTATIGVRGTTFDWYVDEDGEAAVGLVSGGVDVCGADGQCRALDRAGYFLHIDAKGLIGRPAPWNSRFLRRARFATAFPFMLRRERLLPRLRGPRIRIRGLTPRLRKLNLQRLGRALKRPKIRRPRIQRRLRRR